MWKNNKFVTTNKYMKFLKNKSHVHQLSIKIKFISFPYLNVLKTTIVFKSKCTATHSRYTNDYITEAGIVGGLDNTAKSRF